jgi:hypothetical protein
MSTIQPGGLDPLARVLQRAQLEQRFESSRQLERIALPAEDRVLLADGERARLHGLLLESAAALPEVRAERIAQVRARIEAGYYNREEVVERTGEKFLASPEGRQALDGATRASLPAETERADLMDAVREKLRGGFYTDGEVMAFVADRLLDMYKIEDSSGDR